MECTAVFSLNVDRRHRPDDGGSTYLCNVGRHSIYNTAVHLRIFWASVSWCFPTVELSPALDERDIPSAKRYWTQLIPGFSDGELSFRFCPAAAGLPSFLSVQSIARCRSVCSCRLWKLPNSSFWRHPLLWELLKLRSGTIWNQGLNWSIGWHLGICHPACWTNCSDTHSVFLASSLCLSLLTVSFVRGNSSGINIDKAQSSRTLNYTTQTSTSFARGCKIATPRPAVLLLSLPILWSWKKVFMGVQPVQCSNSRPTLL
jgi:hypothetical protein